MTQLVSVAIPVRDGAAALERTLVAVRSQRLGPTVSVELVVCDSGSRDGSAGLARNIGAEVIEIARDSFSHGETRNLLMGRTQGDHVAFLTQDSIPADEQWLRRLLGGFTLADNVALVFGPYRPREDASVMVARELTDWFHSFSADGSPRVDRLAASERAIPAKALIGPRGFFTDANGCVARAAWETVPFRPVKYAEDHVLAHDMLRAGYAKVYLPTAAVIHSHDYSSVEWLRRSFDESRALREVYGFAEPLDMRRNALKVWGLVGADYRWDRARLDRGSRLRAVVLAKSLRHHLARTSGAALGARADLLPRGVVRALSLEGRADDG